MYEHCIPLVRPRLYRLKDRQMTIPASDLRDTISRLHNYVLQTHWNGQAIAGPDAGVRLSSHLGRFIKKYSASL